MSTQAARFVGSIPENYDRGLGPHVFSGYADDLARRSAELNPRSVLELAAGTGIVTRRLRDVLGDSCELVATDLNSPMLEVAQAKFQPDEVVEFEQADATELNFSDATYDLLVCQFGVMFFPDKQQSFAEAHRVLKSTGSYLFNVWGSWDENPFAQITHEVVAQYFPDDPPGFYKVPFSYHDADHIRKSLLDAGFQQVKIDSVSLMSRISSAEVFARGLVFGNPLYEEVTTRGGDPDEICSAVADALDRQLGTEMSLQALVVHAAKD
jgi:ubiquinone/menaquinone biosynthesis C-methylase UbiE